MLIIATFKHSAYLELALKLLEQKGFSKGDMLTAPLATAPQEDMTEFDVVHKNLEGSYEFSFILAMISMLLGSIYGFVLKWGPIIWATIGIFVGALLGLIIDKWIGKKKSKPSGESEVVLIVSCDSQETTTVETILWTHQALGVSKVKT